MKKVMIYGVGKLGFSLLEGLSAKKIELYKYSYTGDDFQEKEFEFNGQKVLICSSNVLGIDERVTDIMENVSVIVVTLAGNVLEKEIDFLLTLDIPLIILSTQYDVEMVRQKAIIDNVTVVMSENIALPIVDFWDRLENLVDFDNKSKLKISITESHQSSKSDISGSAIKVLDLLKAKGLSVDFSDKDRLKYKVGLDGNYGCISCLRNNVTQETYGIPVEHLSGHAYHSFWFYCENINNEKCDDYIYLEYMFDVLRTLVNYSIPGILDFDVNLTEYDEQIVLDVTHNINGRSLYSDGVEQCIKFLQDPTHTGVFSGIDVVKA
jgi:dihydrodipicolinate reductase